MFIRYSAMAIACWLLNAVFVTVAGAAGTQRTCDLFRGAETGIVGKYLGVIDSTVVSGDWADRNYGGDIQFQTGRAGGRTYTAALHFELRNIGNLVEMNSVGDAVLAIKPVHDFESPMVPLELYEVDPKLSTLENMWAEGRSEGAVEPGAVSWNWRRSNQQGTTVSITTGQKIAIGVLKDRKYYFTIPAETMKRWMNIGYLGMSLQLPADQLMGFHSSNSPIEEFRPTLTLNLALIPTAEEALQRSGTAMPVYPKPTTFPTSREMEARAKRPLIEAAVASGWKARVIDAPVYPQPQILQDYATDSLGHPWVVADRPTEMRFDGIAPSGDAAYPWQITKSGAALVFGRDESGQGTPLLIGQGSDGLQWPKSGKWGVLIPLQQNAAESEWRLQLSTNAKPVEVTAKAVGNSTTLTFNIAPGFYRGMRLECVTAGLRCQFGPIRVGRMLRPLHFRYTFTLDDAPAFARLAFSAGTEHKLWVNGRLVSSDWGNELGNKLTIVEIAPYLVRGANTLAVECVNGEWGRAPGLIVEGYARGKQGAFTTVLSNGQWKVSPSYVAGWERPDFRDGEWQAVVEGKKVGDSINAVTGGSLFFSAPYAGPILIPTEETHIGAWRFVKQNTGISLAVGVPTTYRNVTLSYQLQYAESKAIIQEGIVPLTTSDNGVICGQITYKTSRPGVVNVLLSLKDGNTVIDTRREELVVLGRLPQPRVAPERMWAVMKPVLVDTIECGKEPDRPFMDGERFASSRIRTWEHGAFRETAPGSGNTRKGDWFGYLFTVKHPGRPHLMVAEIPDDGFRISEVRVVSNYYVSDLPGATKNAASLYTGYPFPVTGKTKTLQYIFWPDNEEGTVSIVNTFTRGDEYDIRAAAGKISIYEITGEIPAVDVPHPGGRLFGTHTERFNAMLNYTSDEIQPILPTSEDPFFGFWQHWYEAISHMIQVMKLRGDNLHIPGAYMYNVPHFPSEHFATGKLGAAWRYFYDSSDPFDLMIRMMGENDIKVAFGIEFFTSPTLMRRYIPTAKEIAAGMPTIAQVNQSGAPEFSGWGGSRLNFLLPEVEDEMMRLYTEISRRYGDRENVLGICTIYGQNEGWLPSFAGGVSYKPDYFINSYDDTTIERFTRDTGIVVPIARTDPQRFGKRADWLLANQRTAWMQWRAEKIVEFHHKALATIRGINPRWMYFAHPTLNQLSIGYADDRRDKKVDFLELLTREQYNPNLFRNKDGLFAIPGVPSQNQNWWYGTRISTQTGWTKSANAALRWEPEPYRLVTGGANFGLQFGEIFYEHESHTPVGQKWYWEEVTGTYNRKAYGATYVYPSAENCREDFVRLMILSDPNLLLFSLIDVNFNMAQESEMARGVREYLSIPAVPFSLAAGTQPGDNLVIKVARDGAKTHLLVLNPNWWRQEARIVFARQMTGIDRVIGKRITARGTLLLSLAPYQIAVYTFDGEAPIAGFTAQAPATVKEQLSAVLAAARKTANTNADFTAKLDEAATALAARRYFQTWQTLTSPEVYVFFDAAQAMAAVWK